MNRKELVQKQEAYMIAMRREFHQYPELSLQEERTSARICEELSKMGIPYEVVGQRNVIGILEGGKPGKKIAIRADFDALPVKEETGLPFQSQNEGVMHACGHDGHAAILLGTAKALSEIKEELQGTVVFCFQVAEENGVGAMEIVPYLQEKGGVDQVIGLHLMGCHEVGEIFLPDGAIMAGIGGFRIIVTGKGGHGSRPDLSINPIHPACQILLQISSIPTNRHSPFDTCVVSPCKIVGGTANNIIPDTAEIAGNVRYLRLGDAEVLMGEIRRIATNVAASYGATAELIHKKKMGIPVVNNAQCAQKGREIAQEMGLTVLPPHDPNLGNDDFSWLLNEYPGFYANLGCHKEGADTNIHNCRYDIDERSLALGAEFFVSYACDFLK